MLFCSILETQTNIKGGRVIQLSLRGQQYPYIFVGIVHDHPSYADTPIDWLIGNPNALRQCPFEIKNRPSTYVTANLPKAGKVHGALFKTNQDEHIVDIQFNMISGLDKSKL